MNKLTKKYKPKNAPTGLAFGALLGSLLLSLPVQAQTPSLNLQLDLGAEYDSNVSVKELDRVTNAGDWAGVINVGAKTHWAATDKLNVRAGIFHDHKHYTEFDEFDLDVSRGNVEVSYDFSALTLGVSHDVALARLDQQDFLQLAQTRLYASKLIGQNVYLRGQFTQQNKSFTDQPERDADSKIWGGDIYWFMNQANSFVSFGVDRDDEVAQLDNYSYEGVNLRARWSHKFTFLGLASQTQLGWRYSDRDYQGPAIEPSSNALGETEAVENRADRQQHWEAKWTLGLNANVSVAAKIDYADYQSNLASANYQETVSSVQLQTRF